MRLIGKHGTIDVLDNWLQITFNNGDVLMSPMNQLNQWIEKLEIYKTEDGDIRFGSW